MRSITDRIGVNMEKPKVIYRREGRNYRTADLRASGWTNGYWADFS